MDSTVNQRVKQIIENFKLNPNSFFKKIGATASTINSMLEKGTNPSVETVNKILNAFTSINPVWLIQGNGDMLIDLEDKWKGIIEETDKAISEHLKPKVSETKGAPYYDVDFIGGFDLVTNNQTTNPAFYIDFPPYNDVDCWVNATGKSMSPFISHGDIVALKKVKNWKEFLLLGEIYAIVTDEFRTIKIVGRSEVDNHFKLIPYSKSKEFSEQDLPIKLISDVYRVKGSIKKFF